MCEIKTRRLSCSGWMSATITSMKRLLTTHLAVSDVKCQHANHVWTVIFAMKWVSISTVQITWKNAETKYSCPAMNATDYYAVSTCMLAFALWNLQRRASCKRINRPGGPVSSGCSQDSPGSNLCFEVWLFSHYKSLVLFFKTPWRWI